MKDLTEIRWHSRAGQGAITASHALADALGKSLYAQSFPEFGAEKRGASVKVFTRISKNPIEIIHQIQNPDFVVLFDTTLINKGELSWENILEGLSGSMLINTDSKEPLVKTENAVWHLNASRIAREEIGKDIPNVAMVAGFLKISGLFPLDKFKEHLKGVLSVLPQEIVDGNMRAFDRGIKEVIKL